MGLVILVIMAPQFAAAKPQFEVIRFAPGVFVHQGRIEPMSRANLGDIANVGFIVGEDCVAVVDTGGSPQVGAALGEAIRAQTDKPVCYVINTHAHPDHVFGNRAFVDQKPVFIAHEDFAEALGLRMATYLERFSRLYGHRLTADVIVPPDRVITDGATVDLGNRILKLRALSTGHTNTDLVVLDAKTGTLWTGDALFVRHIPVVDGSIIGWLAVMERLSDIPARRAVPGHGPAQVSWPRALEAQRDYLQNMVDEIRALIAQGATIEKAIDTVGRAARDRWLLFDEYHRRNVTAAFAELEWE